MKIVRFGMTESGLLLLSYVSKHTNINMDIKDMINVKNGLYEWKDPKMNKQFMDYFISRKDDEDEDEVILIKVVDETS